MIFLVFWVLLLVYSRRRVRRVVAPLLLLLCCCYYFTRTPVSMRLILMYSRCASVASICCCCCCCCDAAHSLFTLFFSSILSVSSISCTTFFSLYLSCFLCAHRSGRSFALSLCTFKMKYHIHNVPKWIRTDPVDKSVFERNSIETVVCSFPFFSHTNSPAHISASIKNFINLN